VQKVQHKPIKDSSLGLNLKRSEDLSVLWTGAPDCPVCHRTVSGAPCPYKPEAATLGKTQARFAIIHRTVRCASGATANSRNGRLWQELQWAIVPRRSQSSEIRGALDYPVPQEDKVPTVARAPNPNGWVTWRHTVHWTVFVWWRTGLSGAPIDNSLPNDYLGG
jgi:hypothetical protein